MLGQIGGLYEAMFMIGAFFVTVFSERLFTASILSKTKG